MARSVGSMRSRRVFGWLVHMGRTASRLSTLRSPADSIRSSITLQHGITNMSRSYKHNNDTLRAWAEGRRIDRKAKTWDKSITTGDGYTRPFGKSKLKRRGTLGDAIVEAAQRYYGITR